MDNPVDVAPSEAQAPTSPSVEAKPFVLTERAVAQVKEALREQKLEGQYLAVRVVPAGCSGLGYDLNIVKETKSGDVVWEQDGVMIATDPMSQQYLRGTRVDYVKGPTASGFKFDNPNAKSSCGCGSSFSA